MCVSIIIVNYNTKILLRNCLVSIYKQVKDIKFEVIVSDNGSVDGSIQMVQSEFPNVLLIKNEKNIGFGSANNRGLDVAKGKYVFYLNSDTVLLNNAVKKFYDFWENYPYKEKLGAIGCNLIDRNFEITHSAGNFPKVRDQIISLIRLNIIIYIKIIFHIFKYDYQYHNNTLNHAKKKKVKAYFGPVDYITGADLFIKNDNNARFDEKFFLYYEETNLQYQLFLENKQRLLIDGPRIQHIQGGSISKKDNLNVYTSVSMIQNLISAIVYFIINNKRGLLILKILTVITLCNPCFIKKTYKYIKKIIFL